MYHTPLYAAVRRDRYASRCSALGKTNVFITKNRERRDAKSRAGARASRDRPVLLSGSRGKSPRVTHRGEKKAPSNQGGSPLSPLRSPNRVRSTIRSTSQSPPSLSSLSLFFSPTYLLYLSHSIPARYQRHSWRESSRSVLSVAPRAPSLLRPPAPSHPARVRGWLGCCRKGGGVGRQSLRGR